MAGVTITVYGGAGGGPEDGEVGGNRILLEWEEGAWFLDFGSRFKVAGRFYEEFLKPRGSLTGLRDYLRMGLLPPLEGLYRDDLWRHEPDLWERYASHPHFRRVERLDGVLVTHAHLDHCGSLGFLREDVPVYTGLVTAITAKAMQDCRSGGGPESEWCYLQPRRPTAEGCLEAERGAPRRQRRHVIVEPTDPPPDLARFWCSLPGPRTALEPCPLETARPPGLRFWRVDHSIPGSGAFGVHTPVGWVVYTGDLRMHGHSAWRVREFLRDAATLRPTVLVVEGTRVAERGPTVTEPQVKEAADEVVARAPGLVVADFGPRNVERLRSFHEVARARGRRLVVTTRDAYLLEPLHRIDPAIPHPGTAELGVLREAQGQAPHWERGVQERFADNLVSARDVRRNPGEFILCLSFWDIANLIDIDPPGGTYIYSASEAYTEDQAIDLRRLLAWLDHFGFARVGGLPGEERGPYHASGHADGEALEALVAELDPQVVVPVHTECAQWFEDRWPDRVRRAPLGVPLRLD